MQINGQFVNIVITNWKFTIYYQNLKIKLTKVTLQWN